jgi:hypothetical protein
VFRVWSWRFRSGARGSKGRAFRDSRTRLRAARPSSSADSRSSSASSADSSFSALSSSGVSVSAGAGAAAPSFVRLLPVLPRPLVAAVASRRLVAGLSNDWSAGRGGPSRITAARALAARPPARRGLEGSSHCACSSCASSSGPRPCSEKKPLCAHNWRKHHVKASPLSSPAPRP